MPKAQSSAFASFPDLASLWQLSSWLPMDWELQKQQLRKQFF